MIYLSDTDAKIARILRIIQEDVTRIGMASFHTEQIDDDDCYLIDWMLWIVQFPWLHQRE